ncbi:MAG: trehalose-6-phosphate synthase [Candidatus Omnitrophota bacterium]
MIHFKGKDRGLVVVSNRLPFLRSVNKKGESVWEKAAGGLITALEPILLDANGVWLGWDGYPVEEAGKTQVELIDVRSIESKEGLDRKEGKSYRIGCIPVTALELDEYYNRFSNGTIWALFHYFFEKSFIDYTAWRTYLEVNKRFADHIDKFAAKDDVIWIQDFHLFMVPFFLRQLRPDQEIHFFLHIPFPHIDIFSILPWQRQILESLLCCNTVGFHHKQYLRNFAGAVERYRREKRLSHEKTIEEQVQSHFYANPISIDFGMVDKTSRKHSVVKRKNEIRKEAGCPKLIVGIDRIDYSKGIKERLLGLDLLLEEHPDLREKFFYYQLVIPSRETVDTYKTLKKEIDEIIGRINGRFSSGLWTPVHYNYGTVPFEELVALYSAADVALVTPLRDGMNLVCKEYVAAHSDNDGVLVLSKFAGAIAEIKNCLPVNPYSIEDIANSIYQALHMPEKERKKRMIKMRNNIKSNNISTWLENCLHHFDISEEERSGKQKTA